MLADETQDLRLAGSELVHSFFTGAGNCKYIQYLKPGKRVAQSGSSAWMDATL
jgi:hypothetical protein